MFVCIVDPLAYRIAHTQILWIVCNVLLLVVSGLRVMHADVVRMYSNSVPKVNIYFVVALWAMATQRIWFDFG